MNDRPERRGAWWRYYVHHKPIGGHALQKETLKQRDKRKLDLQLDEELEGTFPASDPLKITRFPSNIHTSVKPHTAVELMDRMTKLGLLNRIVDEADGRRVFMKVTRDGERRLRKLSKIHFEELRAIGPTLTRILKPFRRF
jgi:hypothetical protein